MAKRQCQYGRTCLRLNSDHFQEYDHVHLDNIVSATTADNVDEYEFDDDLVLFKETVLRQIKIIRDLNSSSDITALTPKLVIDQKPDIRNLPSCSNVVIKQEVFQGVPIKQENQGVPIKQEPILQEWPEPLQLMKGEPKDETEHFSPYSMAEKIEASHPYNYFLTAIESSPETKGETLTVTFQELFDPSLGELESSVQINFVVESNWLFEQYRQAGQLHKPLLILYGSSEPVLDEMRSNKNMPNIVAHLIETDNGFGSHHTKMMLLAYTDGSMRVVVSTANLYEDDWRNHVQGLWISDRLPPMASQTHNIGDSRTRFRSDLLGYLEVYETMELDPWISRIEKTDFSSVNVFLVNSIPGSHYSYDQEYGLIQVENLLKRHSATINRKVPIVAQCSAMGNFNPWLTNDFIKYFKANAGQNEKAHSPRLKLIYPTSGNVWNCHDGLNGAGCLQYRSDLHKRQKWITDHMFEWKADGRYRTGAMPHIKTYARWTGSKLYWFLLTSANLSKSAWGSWTNWDPEYQRKGRKNFRIYNYEVGVMFFPKFITNTEYFSMDASDHSTPVFPSLYDIPLTKYTEDDDPYVKE